MQLRVFFIAVITYALGMLDTVGLIGRYVMNENLGQTNRIGYVQMFKRYRWQGLGYLALADFVRALLVVLVGGLLMKQPGFPSVGKQLAMFFALVGQAMPILRRFQPKEDLIFPAMLLLFIDWRVFLICVGAGLLLMVLTGNHPALLTAVLLLYPIFIGIFGGWWLKILLAFFTSAVVFHIYRFELLRFYRQLFGHINLRKAAPARRRLEEDDDLDDPEDSYQPFEMGLDDLPDDLTDRNDKEE